MHMLIIYMSISPCFDVLNPFIIVAVCFAAPGFFVVGFVAIVFISVVLHMHDEDSISCFMDLPSFMDKPRSLFNEPCD